MWQRIKSLFILKKIFVNLELKIKLNVIIYNKNIQSKFNLNIIDYKRLSGKYKVEKNDKIYLYNSYNHRLLFEGQYSKGRKNGKGKEYNEENEIIFEGEYLNGKKWKGKGYDNLNNEVYELNDGKGYIKEYYYSGKIEFEGEYLNGEKNGKGKEYYDNGELKFEGEYLYGYKRKGKDYINKRLAFEGECLFEKK